MIKKFLLSALVEKITHKIKHTIFGKNTVLIQVVTRYIFIDYFSCAYEALKSHQKSFVTAIYAATQENTVLIYLFSDHVSL